MKSLHHDKPVTDREISLRRLGGDEKLLAELAVFFLEDAPALITQIGHAYDSGDLEVVAQRAHSLRGLSATFEAIPVLQLTTDIESMARAGDYYHLDEMIPELKIEFERLISHLQSMT